MTFLDQSFTGTLSLLYIAHDCPGIFHSRESLGIITARDGSSRFVFIAEGGSEKEAKMLLSRPEFVFEGTAEKRKRICEDVSE